MNDMAMLKLSRASKDADTADEQSWPVGSSMPPLAGGQPGSSTPVYGGFVPLEGQTAPSGSPETTGRSFVEWTSPPLQPLYSTATHVTDLDQTLDDIDPGNVMGFLKDQFRPTGSQQGDVPTQPAQSQPSTATDMGPLFHDFETEPDGPQQLTQTWPSSATSTGPPVFNSQTGLSGSQQSADWAQPQPSTVTNVGPSFENPLAEPIGLQQPMQPWPSTATTGMGPPFYTSQTEADESTQSANPTQPAQPQPLTATGMSPHLQNPQTGPTGPQQPLQPWPSTGTTNVRQPSHNSETERSMQPANSTQPVGSQYSTATSMGAPLHKPKSGSGVLIPPQTTSSKQPVQQQAPATIGVSSKAPSSDAPQTGLAGQQQAANQAHPVQRQPPAANVGAGTWRLAATDQSIPAPAHWQAGLLHQFAREQWQTKSPSWGSIPRPPGPDNRSHPRIDQRTFFALFKGSPHPPDQQWTGPFGSNGVVYEWMAERPLVKMRQTEDPPIAVWRARCPFKSRHKHIWEGKCVTIWYQEQHDIFSLKYPETRDRLKAIEMKWVNREPVLRIEEQFFAVVKERQTWPIGQHVLDMDVKLENEKMTARHEYLRSEVAVEFMAAMLGGRSEEEAYNMFASHTEVMWRMGKPTGGYHSTFEKRMGPVKQYAVAVARRAMQLVNDLCDPRDLWADPPQPPQGEASATSRSGGQAT